VRLLYISHSLFAGKRTSHPTVAICIFPEGVVDLPAITDLGYLAEVGHTWKEFKSVVIAPNPSSHHRYG
jgi:hypothetical protein